MHDHLGAYTNCSVEVHNFLSLFDNLNSSQKLSMLAIILDQVEHGLINSENNIDSGKVSDDGYIVNSSSCGLGGKCSIVFELVYKATSKTGSYPRSYFFDVIDEWIERTENLNKSESDFNKLSFKDKLYALVEIFCRIGNHQIPFDFDKYNYDGYEMSHWILDLIQEQFPEEKNEELPF